MISRWIGSSAVACVFGVAGIAAIACTRDDTRREGAAETTAAPAWPVRAPTTGAQSLVFDPATVKVGDTLGGLRVARADVARGADDMGYVGDVRFDGEVTVSGERMTHPDYPEVKEVCMSVDSASAHRLPRFPGDTRRVWLCFEDRDEAARQLGPAGTRGAMTVVIDRYQTVRHFSDTYDTAILRRVVADRREP